MSVLRQRRGSRSHADIMRKFKYGLKTCSSRGSVHLELVQPLSNELTSYESRTVNIKLGFAPLGQVCMLVLGTKLLCLLFRSSQNLKSAGKQYTDG
jgi:hypothetical protein